jgi:hypothetical protein
VDQLVAIDASYRKAMLCRACFEGERKVNSGCIDVAQPRWIGEQYFSARRRVLFVLLNPGSGRSNDDHYSKEARRLMHEYRDRRVKLADVLNHQLTHIPDWGRKRFLKFYIHDLGLELDHVAFLNIALCSTIDNRCPEWMLMRCFEKHTGQLIQALDPTVVLLSGKRLESFRESITRDNPGAKTKTILHYANRKSKEDNALERLKILAILEQV